MIIISSGDEMKKQTDCTVKNKGGMYERDSKKNEEESDCC